MSLLEVLIAMFVLTIGLLGVAALIPVGGLALSESEKVDRAGSLGRAALAEVQTRRMLDYNRWSNAAPAGGGSAFVIDPLGVARGLPNKLGVSSPVERVSLLPNPPDATVMDWGLAERIFMGHDDLTFIRPENMTPPPATISERPTAGVDAATGTPQFEGRYSWLLTVSPTPGEAMMGVAQQTVYTVSVAVCFNRSFAERVDGNGNSTGLLEGEHVAGVNFGVGTGCGGGSVLLSPDADKRYPLKLRTDQWIMLAGTTPAPQSRTICQWYRVVSADGGEPTTRVSLVGPDWDTSIAATAIAIDQVVGVYTSTIDIER